MPAGLSLFYSIMILFFIGHQCLKTLFSLIEILMCLMSTYCSKSIMYRAMVLSARSMNSYSTLRKRKFYFPLYPCTGNRTMDDYMEKQLKPPSTTATVPVTNADASLMR